MGTSPPPAGSDPYHFGRLALALSLLPWTAWALLRTFHLNDGLPAELLQFVIMLALPAALILGAIGLYADPRKSLSVSALAVTLIYTFTFFLLLLRDVAHQLLAPH